MSIWYKTICLGCVRQQSACPTCSGISPGTALCRFTSTSYREFPHQSVELGVSVGSPECVDEWQLKWNQEHSPCTFRKAQPSTWGALPVRSDDMRADLGEIQLSARIGKGSREQRLQVPRCCARCSQGGRILPHSPPTLCSSHARGLRYSTARVLNFGACLQTVTDLLLDRLQPQPQPLLLPQLLRHVVRIRSNSTVFPWANQKKTPEHQAVQLKWTFSLFNIQFPTLANLWKTSYKLCLC